MRRGGVGEGLGWAAVAGVAACCGVTALVAAGVAGAVLWKAGLGLLGVAVFAGGGVPWASRRQREHNWDARTEIDAAGNDSRGGQR